MNVTNNVSFLEVITAVGSILTPLLVLVLSGIGWKYRQTLERRIKLEERLREDRIGIYNQILEPFIVLFMPEESWVIQHNKKFKGKSKNEVALHLLLSLEYRKVAFQLSLIGSDSVLSSFNNLMQYSYSLNTKGDQAEPKELMLLLGDFLLEIRKSIGNDATQIDSIGMLEWFISDARSYR